MGTIFYSRAVYSRASSSSSFTTVVGNEIYFKVSDGMDKLREDASSSLDYS